MCLFPLVIEHTRLSHPVFHLCWPAVSLLHRPDSVNEARVLMWVTSAVSRPEPADPDKVAFLLS